MSGVVIVCAGAEGVIVNGGVPPVGLYLERYDPEAHDGLGDAWWTETRAAAMVFADVRAALECWRTVPRCRPVRADGRPNRPLTAYTVELARADGVV